MLWPAGVGGKLGKSGQQNSHFTLSLTADSLPRLLSILYSTDWPSLSEFSPALSTAEILTNTCLPPLEANSPGLVTRERKCYIKSYGNRQTLSDGSEAPLVGTAPVHMGNI